MIDGLDLLRQQFRPSPHSIVILFSHVGYIICLWKCWRRNLLYESLTCCLATLISMMYHVCDERIHCLAMPIEAWHFLDVYYTFYTVMVLTLWICGVDSGDVKLMMVNIYSSLMVALVHQFRFTAGANFVLWIIPLLFFAISFFNKQVRHIETTKLVRMFLHLFVAVASFVLANFTGFNRESDDFRYQTHPSAPETDFYWLFHSAWHLFSQAAIYFLFDSHASQSLHRTKMD